MSEKKHDFQVGDRVVCKNGLRGGAAHGFGHVVEVLPYGIDIRFDDEQLNRPHDNVWCMSVEDISHDLDIHVGDWVRYDPVHETLRIFSYKGEVGQVCELRSKKLKVDFPKHGCPAWYQRVNCVKIQPKDDILFINCSAYGKEGEMSKRMFNKEDHVALTYKGSECSSTSLQEGDTGVVKDYKWTAKYKDIGLPGYYWQYRVVFQTKNGPRSQWVYEYNLTPYVKTEDYMLKRLEEKVKGLKKDAEDAYEAYESRREAYESCRRLHDEASGKLWEYQEFIKWLGK